MKYIPFTKHGNWDTKSVMMLVLNQNPRGMDLDAMRRRIAIMNQIEEAKAGIVLKTDEHTLICDAIKAFPFGVAHKDLLAAIDAVLEADEPSAVMLPKKNGKDHRAAKDAPPA